MAFEVMKATCIKNGRKQANETFEAQLGAQNLAVSHEKLPVTRSANVAHRQKAVLTLL
ncbi:hypothetical protein [Ralstonia sp.]|uniref:hypothetical protein n=1 Tax=Ralstonia sp. TaxID=54061 RepID=UPI0031DD44FF